MSLECYDNGVSGAYRRCQEMILKHAPGLMATGDMANKPGLVRWSEKELALLRSMYDRGYTVGQTSRYFERHYNSVYKVFSKWRKHGAT